MEWLPDVESDEVEGPRDPRVDQAKEALRVFYRENPTGVFYQQQLAVIFEDTFFHWVTVRALYELAEEGRLIREELPMPSGLYPIRVYHVPTHRNWRRQAYDLVRAVAEYSNDEFARAVGRQGEAIVDAALPRYGFMPKAVNVNEWRGRRWDRSGHDLDRVFEADGRAYGVEIKNTLKYIPKGELTLKTEMCAVLGLIPLFILRFAPKSYTYQVYKAGGFCLLFKDQLYPFGAERLAERMRNELKLPVHCPPAMPAGHVLRFVNWHTKIARAAAEAAAAQAVENADSASNQRREPASD
jgi:hypothetical protein